MHCDDCMHAGNGAANSTPAAPSARTYGCTDYRDEMRLLALKRQLEGRDLEEAARREIEALVAAIERDMGM